MVGDSLSLDVHELVLAFQSEVLRHSMFDVKYDPFKESGSCEAETGFLT